MYLDSLCVYHEGGKSVEHFKENENERQMYISKIGAKSCQKVLYVLLHKNNKAFWNNILNCNTVEYTEMN